MVSAANRGQELEDGSTTYTDLSTNKQYTVCFASRRVTAAASLEGAEESDTRAVGARVGEGIRKYLDEFFSKNSAGFGKMKLT